jgi:hypothetical protein
VNWAVAQGAEPVPTTIFHENLSAFSFFVPTKEKREYHLAMCVIACVFSSLLVI